jgi:hypothetical protein
MWNKPGEDKKLTEGETRFLIAAANQTVGEILLGLDIKHETGIECLDRMDNRELMLCIQQVVAKAVNPTIPTYCNEAAWEEATMFMLIENQVATLKEFEDIVASAEGKEEKTYAKEKVKEMKNLILGLGDGLEELEEEDLSDPENLIEIVADRFLFDRDFEMESPIQNRDPINRKDVLQAMDIPDDYYLNPGPKGSKKDELEAIEWLKAMDEYKNKATKKSDKDLKADSKALKNGESVMLSFHEKQDMEKKLKTTLFPILCSPKNGRILWGDIKTFGKNKEKDEIEMY